MYFIKNGYLYGKILNKVTIFQQFLKGKEVDYPGFSDLTKGVKNCQTELNA
jgi:hypothetical protein